MSDEGLNDGEKRRRERQHRRNVVNHWKNIAAEIKDTADNDRIKMLHREAKREALARIEDAARTVGDFENVMVIWDKLANTEDERIASHETVRSEELLNWQVGEVDVVIPQPIDRVYYRWELKGDFLDTIFDCPHEIHKMTACRLVYEMTESLKELHKELLYYHDIRRWSAQQISAMCGTTDRNIRKVYNKMMDEMKRELFYYLYWRHKKNLPITTTQRKFVMAGINIHGEPNVEGISLKQIMHQASKKGDSKADRRETVKKRHK